MNGNDENSEDSSSDYEPTMDPISDDSYEYEADPISDVSSDYEPTMAAADPYVVLRLPVSSIMNGNDENSDDSSSDYEPTMDPISDDSYDYEADPISDDSSDYEPTMAAADPISDDSISYGSTYEQIWGISDEEMSGSSDEEPKMAAPAKRRTIREDEGGIGIGEDRISELPDPILVHILSLLPTTKEAIRTGIFSKRWRYVWTSVTSLVFNLKQKHFSSSSSSIGNMLRQISSLKLEKFKVDMDTPVFMEQCIEFSVERFVKELYIHLNCSLKHDFAYEVPKELFRNNVLTKLVFGGKYFLIQPDEPIYWKSLTSLRIDGISLTNDLIRNILSGSPVLETLELCGCCGFNCIIISSPRMRKLVLNGYRKMHRYKNAVLEITAPYILSLDIKGKLRLKSLVLLDVHSLHTANMTFNLHSRTSKETMWKGLLQSIHDVHELTLEGQCLEVLHFLNVGNHLSSKNCAFASLKIVKIVYNNEWVSGFIEITHSLLKIASMLEEVIICAGSRLAAAGCWNLEAIKRKLGFCRTRNVVIRFVGFDT